jgi:hypothetical protein
VDGVHRRTQDGLGSPGLSFDADGPGAGSSPASIVLSTGLCPYVEQAFTAEHVAIDFAGFSGETLHSVIQEPFDKIRTGEIKPASVSIRMLLPDTTRPMAVLCRVDDLADDPDYRARMHQVTGRHAYAILETAARPHQGSKRQGQPRTRFPENRTGGQRVPRPIPCRGPPPVPVRLRPGRGRRTCRLPRTPCALPH